MADETTVDRDEETTVAIIRRWRSGECKGQLLVLFPELPADIDGRFCESWDPGSGHGGASYWHMVIQLSAPTRPANPDDDDVKRAITTLEEGYGYRLRVMKRRTPQMDANYRANLHRMRHPSGG